MLMVNFNGLHMLICTFLIPHVQFIPLLDYHVCSHHPLLALQHSTQIIIVRVATFFITGVTSSVISTLVAVFLTRKCQKRSTSKESHQQKDDVQDERDGVYELIGGVVRKEAVYETGDCGKGLYDHQQNEGVL